jgi:hypothetical protein
MGLPSVCRGAIGYAILPTGAALASTGRQQDRAFTMLDVCQWLFAGWGMIFYPFYVLSFTFCSSIGNVETMP